MKHERIPQSQVLTWLQEQHPALSEHAVLDRDWVWLTANLSGEPNAAARESLKAYGFRFAKRGHPLPGGSVGTWGHSCLKPIPFKRRQPKDGGQYITYATPKPQADELDPELLAFIGSNP